MTGTVQSTVGEITTMWNLNFVLSILSVLILNLGVISGDSNISPALLSRVKSSLQRALREQNLPNELTQWMAVLHENMHVLNCLPTTQISSKCYESPRYCAAPKLKILGQPLMIKLAICKNPWKIIFHLQMPKLPWYARARFGPIVIPINHHNKLGVTLMNSVTTGKASILGVFNVLKAELKINAVIRWDCTKPVNKKYDWVRAAYNRGYNDGKPGLDYNKHYYKFHVRFELKKKKFPCFCYRCTRCEDLIKKQGHFGEGPRSCIAYTLGARPPVFFNHGRWIG